MRTDSGSLVPQPLEFSPAETMALIAALAGVAALVLKFVRRTKRRVITFNDVKTPPRAWPQHDGEMVHGRLPMMGQTVKQSEEASYVNPKDVWVPSALERTMVRVEVPVDLEKGLRSIEVHTAQIDTQHDLSTDPEYRLREQTVVRPEPEPTQPEDAALEEQYAGMLTGESEPHKVVCPFPNCGKTFAKHYELNHHARYHLKNKLCPHRSCSESFSTSKDLNRHINSVHQTTKRYYCAVPGCKYAKISGTGASFSRKDNWRRHVSNTHKKIAEELLRDGDEMEE